MDIHLGEDETISIFSLEAGNMIYRSLVLMVFCSYSTVAKADLLLDFIDTNTSNNLAPSYTASILSLSGVNRIDSLELNYLKFFAPLTNVTAELKIYDWVDPYNASNVFGAPIESHTFNMGNYAVGLIRTNVSFDFAAVGKQFQVNDAFGIELTFKANGVITNAVRPVINYAFGWNGTTGTDFWYADGFGNTPADQTFTEDERNIGALQWRVNGITISAVPEPSSLALVGVAASLGFTRIRRTKHSRTK